MSGFEDSYIGSAASFVGRSPTVGGAYTLGYNSGSSTLAGIYVDGAGNVPLVAGGFTPPRARSMFSAPNVAWSVEYQFRITRGSVVGLSNYDIYLIVVAGTKDSGGSDVGDGSGDFLNYAEVDIEFWGGAYHASCYAGQVIEGVTDSDSSFHTFVPTADTQTVRVEVTPGVGTVFKLDGATIFTTAIASALAPDYVDMTTRCDGIHAVTTDARMEFVTLNPVAIPQFWQRLVQSTEIDA